MSTMERERDVWGRCEREQRVEREPLSPSKEAPSSRELRLIALDLDLHPPRSLDAIHGLTYRDKPRSAYPERPLTYHVDLDDHLIIIEVQEPNALRA